MNKYINVLGKLKNNSAISITSSRSVLGINNIFRSHNSTTLRLSYLQKRSSSTFQNNNRNELDYEVIKSEIETDYLQFARRPFQRLTMNYLTRFGSGKPTEEQIIQNAQDTVKELKVHFAHRLRALRKLPYLVVLNPSISFIYGLYLSSYKTISSCPIPTNLEENKQLLICLQNILDSHTDTLPQISKGFSEVQKYMKPAEISFFLNKHLKERIATRTLSKHHISLCKIRDENDHSIGMVNPNLKISEILNHCNEFVGNMCEIKYGTSISVKIDKGEDVTTCYIPTHLEYVLTELLKNSSRASIENDRSDSILATIVKTDTGAVIRLRDRGGGIPSDYVPKVFDYSFTSVESHEGDAYSTVNSALPGLGGGDMVAGMGYGLPLSRAYLQMFGGNLDIQSYYGWGTDAYIQLKCPNLTTSTSS